jgi:hypothetical protein
MFKHPLISRLEFLKISDTLSKCEESPSIRALPNGTISIWSFNKKDYDMIEKARFELLFNH